MAQRAGERTRAGRQGSAGYSLWSVLIGAAGAKQKQTWRLKMKVYSQTVWKTKKNLNLAFCEKCESNLFFLHPSFVLLHLSVCFGWHRWLLSYSETCCWSLLRLKHVSLCVCSHKFPSTTGKLLILGVNSQITEWHRVQLPTKLTAGMKGGALSQHKGQTETPPVQKACSSQTFGGCNLAEPNQPKMILLISIGGLAWAWFRA